VGLDADSAHTALAARFVTDRRLSGVAIVTADARRTGLPSGSFDLVHARTLLVNRPEPAQVMAEMVRLAKPGASVAVAEPDTEHALCWAGHGHASRDPGAQLGPDDDRPLFRPDISPVGAIMCTLCAVAVRCW
jgi:ubiquinone/menaquinone biosynthesis C-methylase UbiE